MVGAPDDASRRAARREFVRLNHPDRGGDERRFVEGLAAFDRKAARPTRPAPVRQQTPVTVIRTRSVRRTLLRAVREARRRIEKRPARRLL